MPYYFSQGGGSPIEIAGYYFVQPFSFKNSLLQRNPRSARLAVTVALTGYDHDEYPSVTTGLATTGEIAISTDEVDDAILRAEGFTATAVSSSQSRDLALTTWIFEGSANSNLDYAPAAINIAPQPGRVPAEHRVRWFGHADTGQAPDVARLNLGYLASQVSYGLRRDLTAIDLIGISNMMGSGSLVHRLLGHPLNVRLGAITVSDVSRNTNSTIGGPGPDPDQQMAAALGSAYIFNGIFKNLPVASVATFSRQFTDGSADVIRDASHAGSSIFADMTQRVSDTIGGTKRNADSYAINGPDFEGLSFWGLEPRGAVDAALLY